MSGQLEASDGPMWRHSPEREVHAAVRARDLPRGAPPTAREVQRASGLRPPATGE